MWLEFESSLLQDGKAGADPGLPVGGGTNPPGGAPTYDFAKFCQKLHEIENILGCSGGGAHWGHPPKSATAKEQHHIVYRE